ncbi:unnamed protein product [Amaranthus hypochondriacus]
MSISSSKVQHAKTMLSRKYIVTKNFIFTQRLLIGLSDFIGNGQRYVFNITGDMFFPDGKYFGLFACGGGECSATAVKLTMETLNWDKNIIRMRRILKAIGLPRLVS